MFDSAKKELAQDIIFVERVRTLLFLSMALNRTISILFLKGDQYLSQGVLKTGVVTTVSSGAEPEWKKCTTGSFLLDIDDGDWNEIKNVLAVSFSGEKDPIEFFKHEDTLNRIQHLGSIYTKPTGRNKIDIEIDDGNSSKYYRTLSTITGT